MSSPFRLARQLQSHQKDVRAVAFVPSDVDGLILSGSRDHTAKLWPASRNEDGTSEVPMSTLTDHTGFVMALAVLPSSDVFPTGALATGSQDNRILVYSLADISEPVFTLLGHTSTVCALSTTVTGDIISGSWDTSARIWSSQNANCQQTLNGHESAVWAVLGLPNGTIVTASADKTIRMWTGGVSVRSITGHTDCVRGLALLPSGFVSCSNDASLRIYSLEGDLQQSLFSHSNYVYGVASVMATGELVSCGEDSCVKVWREGECVQTIAHPAKSVWAVAALPSGDVVSGSSDGVVRVFSRDPARIANAETIATFDAAVASQTVSAREIGGIDVATLPDESALSVPGAREGQTKMVRNAQGKVDLYSWSAGEAQWSKVGEVVDTAANASKQLYDGREYDYVFDIDLGDGIPARKLPFNVTENPWMAAYQFVERNLLDTRFVQEIAEFITTNTKGVELGGPVGSGNADPLTRSEALPPPSSMSAPSHAPLGGQMPPARARKHIPLKLLLAFESGNHQAIHDKLLALSASSSDIPDSARLGPTAIEHVAHAFLALQHTPSSIDSGVRDTLAALLTDWPSHTLFPAIDLMRLLVLTPAGAQLLSDGPITAALLSILSNAASPPPALMLTLRFFTNAFRHASSRSAIIDHRASVLVAVTDIPANVDHPGVRLALATLLLNFTVVLRSPLSFALPATLSADTDSAMQCMSTLLDVLKRDRAPETCYRALVALGTLVLENNDARANGQLFDMAAVVHALLIHAESKVRLAAEETRDALAGR